MKMTVSTVSDEELLQQFRHGNKAVLEVLVYRYHKLIYLYIARLMNDSVLAEDLTQECFLRVCSTLQSERIPARFRPWIYRIATNLCRDVWKSSAYQRETLVKDEVLSSLFVDKETVVSILEKQLEREAVIGALQQLPVEERQIVILRFYHQMKLDEMADMMELPLSTVKTKLYKSFRMLAAILNREEEVGHEQQNIR